MLARNAFLGYAVNERVVRYGIADPPPASEAQLEAFRRAVPALKDRRFLLYLSRIHPKKGCDLLIRAFAGLARRDPSIDLVIAGPDDTNWRPALEQIAEAEGVGGRIHWPGMVRGDAKWGAFRACEAFILPSHQENFGIVVAEALACGKAVLISNRVNIWREVLSYNAGLAADDTVEGARALIEGWAVQTPAERQDQAAAARKCFSECFDIAQTSLDILGLVKEIRQSAADA